MLNVCACFRARTIARRYVIRIDKNCVVPPLYEVGLAPHLARDGASDSFECVCDQDPPLPPLPKRVSEVLAERLQDILKQKSLARTCNLSPCLTDLARNESPRDTRECSATVPGTDAGARHTSDARCQTAKQIPHDNRSKHALGYQKIFCQVSLQIHEILHTSILVRIHIHELTRAAFSQVQPEELAADAGHVCLVQHLKRRRKHKGDCAHSPLAGLIVCSPRTGRRKRQDNSLTGALSKLFKVQTFVRAGMECGGRPVQARTEFDQLTRRAYIGAQFMKLVFRHKPKARGEVNAMATRDESTAPL